MKQNIHDKEKLKLKYKDKEYSTFFAQHKVRCGRLVPLFIPLQLTSLLNNPKCDKFRFRCT